MSKRVSYTGGPLDPPLTRHAWERLLALNEPGQLSPPIWSCTARGLPCRQHHCRRGGLLPHLFTLTCGRTIRRHPEGFPPGYHRVPLRRRYLLCGTFRGAFVEAVYTATAFAPPGVTRRVALPYGRSAEGSAPFGAAALRREPQIRSGVRTFLPIARGPARNRRN